MDEINIQKNLKNFTRSRLKKKKLWQLLHNTVNLINKKIILAILISVIFLVGYGIQSYTASPPKPSTIRAEGVEVLPPIHIRIPSLGIKTIIEPVGKDSEGRMDVPKKPATTAWYNLGPRPGNVGNAVIAGHLNTPEGKPAVFYKLHTMKKGDIIEVEDAAKNIYVYRVVETTIYPLATFPIEKVFGSNKKARLNLITCAGSYDKTAKTYEERTVVFSELTDIRKKR